MIGLGPFIGFGAGYTARTLGLDPLSASSIALGVGVAYRAGLGGALRAGGMWLAGDLYAGAAAAAGASTAIAATLAVAIPVAIGYTAATVISGETGRDQLTDFLTGNVSPAEYRAALAAAHNRERNLAVQDNAAGVLVGLPVYDHHLRREAESRGIPIEEYYQYGMALREFELGYTNVDPRV